MKIKKLILSIPEPCHEDWNKMTPDAKGRFCGSCNKSVYDLSNKSDEEIHDILKGHESGKICGHVKNTQLNRPLNFSVPLHLLPTNASPFRAFAMALFLVFGTTLFSCTNDRQQKVGEINVVPQMKTELVNQVLDEKMEEQKQIGPKTVEPRVEIPIQTSSCMHTGGAIVSSYTEVEIMEEPIHYEGGLSYRYEEYDVPHLQENYIKELPLPLPLEILKDFSFSTYPNPSSGTINISYEVLQKGNVEIALFDLNGTLLRTIVNAGEQYEGTYIIPTDLSDLANGIYICRIVNNGKEKAEKIILAK
jgi:hypothetical protein